MEKAVDGGGVFSVSGGEVLARRNGVKGAVNHGVAVHNHEEGFVALEGQGEHCSLVQMPWAFTLWELDRR